MEVNPCFFSSLQKSCVDRGCTEVCVLSLFVDIRVSTHLDQVRFFFVFLGFDGFLDFPFEDENGSF